VRGRRAWNREAALSWGNSWACCRPRRSGTVSRVDRMVCSMLMLSCFCDAHQAKPKLTSHNGEGLTILLLNTDKPPWGFRFANLTALTRPFASGPSPLGDPSTVPRQSLRMYAPVAGTAPMLGGAPSLNSQTRAEGCEFQMTNAKLLLLLLLAQTPIV